MYKTKQKKLNEKKITLADMTLVHDPDKRRTIFTESGNVELHLEKLVTQMFL